MSDCIFTAAFLITNKTRTACVLALELEGLVALVVTTPTMVLGVTSIVAFPTTADMVVWTGVATTRAVFVVVKQVHTRATTTSLA